MDTEWEAGTFDVPYYRGLLEKAWGEVEYAFTCGRTPVVSLGDGKGKTGWFIGNGASVGG